jgi:methyltransferase (TIGR00027 family)
LPVRSVSDTARWTAAFRARETARPDARFRDPLAARLAGEHGEALARRMGQGEWAFLARTVWFDGVVRSAVAGGADGVVNLAAGFDARPYRMDLPASLRWVEVDLPALLEEKEGLLAGERPACRLERVPLDLADGAARRALFGRLGGEARSVLVLAEGLLAYLEEEAVASLARDLAAAAPFRQWAVDLMSPGMLRILRKEYSRDLDRAGAPLLFGPETGTAFFEPHGWRAREVRSILRVGREIRRAPFLVGLLSLLPDPDPRRPGGRPWGGLCLLERADPTAGA